ncbi:MULTISPECIES: LysR family transcriptional regulator [unclassified Achromobacter]|uniref:LysR family transcriptional regulator n=1 Tax=unclassified Achromobacter TaxID=2626865 RepID=UPI00069D2284|nr:MULTISPECIES: LysR family transcriptional regulator [unclassified Achromobacter]KOF53139.1 LysR family transcriptional regulator [Achromobacter sp. DMS1]
MDLKHIRSFAAVAREGNLTRAAEHLHVTQPALSLQLKSFQEALDLSLFTRTAQGLAPNAEGRALLPSAQRVLEALDDFQRAIGALRSTVRGDLRLGTILDPEFLRLGAAMRHLVARYPQIRPVLRHGMSGWVARQVRAGELDAGFYLGPLEDARAAPALHAVPLATFSYYVIAPQGWGPRMAGRGWEDIAALPWIGTPPDSAHHRLLARKFEELGVTVNAVAEVDQESSMLDLVRSGVGLSLARDSIALRESQAHGLLLAQHLSITTSLSFVSLASRRDDPLPAAASAAVQAAFS